MRPTDFTASIILVCTATLAGCANWRQQVATASHVSETRKERHAAAVAAFEAQRDQAQLAAALDRYQQGDIAGCESRLRSLIARRPNFAEAHVQLAELAWSYGNAAEAEAEYRAALELAPNRADVHHALGLVLEASGRSADAQEHLEKACQLDPGSEIYQAFALPSAPTAASPTPGASGNLAAR
jgi:Tfp pilus assembly protein PilF